jgi:hypothetical protein
LLGNTEAICEQWRNRWNAIIPCVVVEQRPQWVYPSFVVAGLVLGIVMVRRWKVVVFSHRFCQDLLGVSLVCSVSDTPTE